jgi:hypothetical protein
MTKCHLAHGIEAHRPIGRLWRVPRMKCRLNFVQNTTKYRWLNLLICTFNLKQSFNRYLKRLFYLLIIKVEFYVLRGKDKMKIELQKNRRAWEEELLLICGKAVDSLDEEYRMIFKATVATRNVRRGRNLVFLTDANSAKVQHFTAKNCSLSKWIARHVKGRGILAMVK